MVQGLQRYCARAVALGAGLCWGECPVLRWMPGLLAPIEKLLEPMEKLLAPVAGLRARQ